MPLRDHFHPPFSKRYSWDVVHGGWPMVIATAINRLLPERYSAYPSIHIGSVAEIDIGTFEEDDREEATITGTDSGTATATAIWTSPAPSLTIPADWSATDTYEVRIYDFKKQRELVAAIELVSPSNLDREEARRHFVSKCVGLLQAGVSVTIVDVVTDRRSNLYAEMLELLNQTDPLVPAPAPSIYAVSCRTRAAKQGEALETWYFPLEIGKPLPTLPVWLGDRLAVPLELESMYEETLRALRIR